MNNNSGRKPPGHLINILKATSSNQPNYVLFLGAGASKTSGVKVASDMIIEWRKNYYEMYGHDQNQEEFLKAQSWYDTQEEYSILFEMLYDQASQRRECIESFLAEASPSWGYIYLVNLLQAGVFNAVLTTNFDDLLNEACYQFSDSVRPLVCAHDSSIWSVRITSKRPKIIKLHGDFLFDNIKNTVSELESLEGNMKDKVKQYASEYGLIIVGYSGSDRSIMDTLNTLLRNDLNFPHGVYWCVRKGEQINKNVESLLRFPRLHLIEIEDFDNLFADIHASLKIRLQPEMSDPYGSLAKRLNNLISSAKIPKPIPNAKPSVIQKDIEMIGQKISEFSRLNSATPSISSEVEELQHNIAGNSNNVPMPYIMLADIEERRGNAKAAIELLLCQLAERPSSRGFSKTFNLLSRKELASYADQAVSLLLGAKDVLVSNPWMANEFALTLISAGLYAQADKVLDLGIELWSRPEAPSAPGTNSIVYILNKLQIKIHMGKTLEQNDIATLEQIAREEDPLNQMGANIILGNYSLAQEQMLAAIEENRINPGSFESWPIFRLLDKHLDNPELQDKLMRSGGENLHDLDELKRMVGQDKKRLHDSDESSDNEKT